MEKIVLVALLLLAGCDSNSMSKMEIANKLNTNPIRDVCLQKVYFDDCMKALPAGPTSTNYNDWSEVVSACTDSAKELAYRQSKDVKEECKTGYTY